QYGVPTSGPGAAHSGTQLWATNLAGNYANNSNSTLTLPVINGLPAAMTLELWHWHSFEGTSTLYDGGNVKASTDGGSSWAVITPAGGYTGTAYASTPGVGGQQIFGGSSGGWLKKSFDLASYAGQDLTLRLHFGSDNVVNSYPGWYVDDIMVYGVDFTGIAGKPEIAGALPSQYRLGAAYPNPARGMATIAYSLPREGELELIVYNIAGQKVRTLARGAQPAGHHRASWDGRDEAGQAVSAGVYLYRLTAPGWSRTGKLSLVR
ncbi:T9SS type A sorting domain-containing protein, partial [bacterium]|nr:T9SS type A sorting domain-containing protein [bacterium]